MTGMGPRLSGLVCEDDVVVSRAIVVAMRRCGFQSITEVATGREAVVFAGLAQPQVAVIDLALAGARGVGLLGDVVRAAPRCRVVVVSPFEALRSRALAAGASAVCQLPDLHRLQRCLHKALGHAGGSFNECDCHVVGGLGPSVPFSTRSVQGTTTAASWEARFRPWPAS